MGPVQLTAILLAACVAVTLCATSPGDLPDISATGACQAEITAYCTGAAARKQAVANEELVVAGTAVAAGIKPRAHVHSGQANARQQQQQGKTQQQQQSQQQAAAGLLRSLQDAAVAATSLQQVESAALQLLKGKLNLSFPVTDPERLLAGPKHAKCLKNVLLPPQSAMYGSEVLSQGCVKELLGFYAGMAADSAKDYQLIAACAEDTVTHCPSSPSSRLFTCLVMHKHLVKHHCSAALASRLAASAGLFRWDQGLAAACAQDAASWCADEQESDDRLPEVGGFTIGCLRQSAQAAIEVQLSGDTEAEQELQGRLSAGCSQAVFRREMAEAEDVRFSFELSRGCSQELGMHCGQVKPGKGEAMLCLERQLQSWQLGEDCQNAVQTAQMLRAADGRLDWRLRQLCRDDVAKLCRDAQYAGGLDASLMLDDWNAPPTAGMFAVMCLRRHREAITSEPCKDHVRHLAAQAFADAQLDAPLLRACAANISQHCMEPSAALVCLKGLLANGLQLAPGCTEVLQERLLEAADNYDLLPDVGAACKTERRLFCEGVPPAHGAVLDCLADFKDDQRFGDECREALTSQFMLAVGDIRLLTSLHKSCAADAAKLCPNVQPGSGRVIGCLQQNSAAIQSSSCRRQLMRLQGFAAHDYRLDYHLRQACAADVARHCSHVVPGSGRVHACLRQNDARLSQQCRQQVETAEAREHQDLSLNPIIRTVCHSTITSLCGKLSGSITQLIPCLKNHLGSTAFNPACKEAVTAALARKGTKYSLQPELQQACNADVNRLCPGQGQAVQPAAAAGGAAAANTRRLRTLQQAISAVADAASGAAAGAAAAAAVGDGSSSSQELVCLAAHLLELSPGCRQEVAAEVHRELMVYMPGLPLTAACDADAKQLCGTRSAEVSAMLQPGSLLFCLADQPGKLSPGCWALMSLFDREQLAYAKQLAGADPVSGSSAQLGGGAAGAGAGAGSMQHQQQQEVAKAVLEKVSQQVHHQVQSQLQGQLQSQLTSQLNDKLSTELERYVSSLHKGAQSWGFLWGVLASVSLTAIAAGCLAMVRLRGRHGSRRVLRALDGTLVVKDGNV